MNKLVRKVSVPVKCDIHSCKENAKFAIGLEGFSHTWMNLCENCMKIVFMQTREVLTDEVANGMKVDEIKEESYTEYEGAWNWKQFIDEPKPVDAAKEEEIAEVNRAVSKIIRKPIAEIIAEADEEAEKYEEKKDEISENTNIVENNEISSNTKDEFYICTTCGERFPKPSGLKDYRSHIMREHPKHPKKKVEKKNA